MVKGVLGEQRRGGWDEERSRRTATRSQVHAYSTSVTSLVQFPSFPHLLIPPEFTGKRTEAFRIASLWTWTWLYAAANGHNVGSFQDNTLMKLSIICHMQHREVGQEKKDQKHFCNLSASVGIRCIVTDCALPAYMQFVLGLCTRTYTRRNRVVVQKCPCRQFKFSLALYPPYSSRHFVGILASGV